MVAHHRQVHLNPHHRFHWPALPSEYRAGVGAGGQGGVFCEVAFGEPWFWRLPGFFAFGEFLPGELHIYGIIRNINFYYVALFQ